MPMTRTIALRQTRFKSLGIKLALDMAGNILKEFTPDLYRKLFRKEARAALLGPPVCEVISDCCRMR